MTIKKIKVGSTTHDLSAKYDDANNIITNTYLPKLTYEWNKSYNAGGTAGYLLIGSFPMYDSNLTIDIDSTTSTTYHGTVVIATQNVSTTSMGSSHTITVYGDPTGAISDAIRVVWKSGSRNYNVYFVPSTWSKNLIHIRAIGQYLEDTDVSKICTQFTTGTAPATTSGLTVTNALTSAFNLTKDKVTTALGYTPPTTNTTYGVVSTTANGLAPKRDGSTTKYLRADGTWAVPPDNNTTYSAATTSTAGLMSAADKIKLNGIATGANNYTYTLPAATSSVLGGVKIGSNITVSSGTISLTKSNVTTALGYTPPTSNTNTTYTFATGDSNGQIKVTPSGGSAQNISVKGLGSAAYTASTAYATAAQGTLATNAMPKSGGTFTGNVGLGANTLTIGGATVSYNSSSNIFDVSAASGNSATVSVKLGSKTVGSATQPIYFNAGTPTPCTYTLGKSVPSDAKFTDTTYTSLKNPYSLTIQGNGTTLTNGTYDGSAAKTVNITPASIGALSLSGGSLTGAITVPRGTAYQSLDTAGAAKPLVWISSENAVMLGATATDSAHSGNTQVNAPNGSVYLKCKNDKLLQWYYYTDSSAGTKTIFAPSNNAEAKLGSSSYRWYKLYASTACSTSSDEREKSDIMSIDDYPVTYSRDGSGNVFEQLYDKLEPKTYTLNVENSGELHIGFVAQDIVNALEELGLSENDLALLDHDYWIDEETGEEKDRYGLCYEEFAALNTYIIQKLKKRVAEQDEKIAEFESKFAELENKFTELNNK